MNAAAAPALAELSETARAKALLRWSVLRPHLEDGWRWLAALVYTVRRDRAARLAEIRTGFLRDAYLKLSEVTSLRHVTPENSMGMTLALKDIQLLGTPGPDRARRRGSTELRGAPARRPRSLAGHLHEDLRALLGMKPETRSRIVFSVQPPDSAPRDRP